MNLSNLFNGSLRLVKSSDGIALYVRKVNQNHLYFVTTGRGDRRLILNIGSRKHALRKFRQYRPTAVYGQDYFTA